MTPTTFDMARTKSLAVKSMIDREMQERMVWQTGGCWIEETDPIAEYGELSSGVFNTKKAALAAQSLLDEYDEPSRATISEALREAKESGDMILLLLDETMTVIESWPVR